MPVDGLPHGFASWYLPQTCDYCGTENSELILGSDMEIRLIYVVNLNWMGRSFGQYRWYLDPEKKKSANLS